MKKYKIIYSLILLIVGVVFLYSCKKRELKNIDDMISYYEKYKERDKDLFVLDNENFLVNINNDKLNNNYNSLILSSDIKGIKENALANLNNIKYLFIPDQISIIETGAIKNLNNLEKILFIGTKKMSYMSVYNNPFLTSLYFINGQTKSNIISKKNPFILNKNITDIIIKDSNLISYSNGQLIITEIKNDNNIKKVLTLTKNFNGIIEENIHSLGSYAQGFVTFNNFDTLLISDSVVEINEYFIDNGENIKKINFGKNLKELNENFIVKSRINEIKINSENETYKVINNTLCKDNICILLSKNSNIIENSDITIINSFAGAGNLDIDIKTLNNILPNIIEIKEGAFSNCINIKGILDLNLYNNLTTLGDYIFLGIDNISFRVLISSLKPGFSDKYDIRNYQK